MPLFNKSYLFKCSPLKYQELIESFNVFLVFQKGHNNIYIFTPL